MMMMGPQKDKGGLVIAIMKKMKDHYNNGKESNEEFVEQPDVEEDYKHGYGDIVDDIFSAIESKDKEKFGHSLKKFIRLCIEQEEKKEEE